MIKYICTKCNRETTSARVAEAANNFKGFFCDDCYNSLSDEEKNPSPSLDSPIMKIFGRTTRLEPLELLALSVRMVEAEDPQEAEELKAAIVEGFYGDPELVPCVKCSKLVPDTSKVTDCKFVRRKLEKMGDCDYDVYCPECYNGLPFDERYPVICFKCGARSGDSWMQCGGQCPVEGSPYYDPKVEYVNYKERDEDYDPDPDDIPF